MKARIKATGEIINIADNATVTLDVCDRVGYPIEKRFDEVEILQEKMQEETSDDGIDWEQRRYEIALELMKTDFGMMKNDTLAMQSVEGADALITVLRDKKTNKSVAERIKP